MRSGRTAWGAGLGSPAENCESEGIATTAGEPFALKILRGANQKGIYGDQCVGVASYPAPRP
jgi:hypothetical protein